MPQVNMRLPRAKTAPLWYNSRKVAIIRFILWLYHQRRIACDCY